MLGEKEKPWLKSSLHIPVRNSVKSGWLSKQSLYCWNILSESFFAYLIRFLFWRLSPSEVAISVKWLSFSAWFPWITQIMAMISLGLCEQFSPKFTTTKSRHFDEKQLRAFYSVVFLFLLWKGTQSSPSHYFLSEIKLLSKGPQCSALEHKHSFLK